MFYCCYDCHRVRWAAVGCYRMESAAQWLTGSSHCFLCMLPLILDRSTWLPSWSQNSCSRWMLFDVMWQRFQDRKYKEESRECYFLSLLHKERIFPEPSPTTISSNFPSIFYRAGPDSSSFMLWERRWKTNLVILSLCLRGRHFY